MEPSRNNINCNNNSYKHPAEDNSYNPPTKKQKTEENYEPNASFTSFNQSQKLDVALKQINDIHYLLESSFKDELPLNADSFNLLKAQNEKLKLTYYKIDEVLKQTGFIVKAVQDQLSVSPTSLSITRNIWEPLKETKTEKNARTLLQQVFSHADLFDSFLQILLTALKESDEFDLIYLFLLKMTYEKKNPDLFLKLINQLSKTKPSLLSEAAFRSLFAKVFDECEWSDTTIIVQCCDKEVKVPVIFSLLSSNCTFFNGFGDFKESESDQIEYNWKLFSINSENATQIFKFFYSGQIIFSNVIDAARALILAEFLSDKKLVKVCTDWISQYRRWNEEQTFKIYNLGNDLQNNFLKQVVLSYAAFFYINSSSHFKNENFYGRTQR